MLLTLVRSCMHPGSRAAVLQLTPALGFATKASKAPAAATHASAPPAGPKRPLTAWAIFVAARLSGVFDKLKAEGVTGVELRKHAMSRAKQLYDALPAAERAEYESKAEALRKKYNDAKGPRPAPQKPRSGWAIYVVEQMQVLAKDPSSSPGAERLKQVAAGWRGLTEQQKQAYNDKVQKSA